MLNTKYFITQDGRAQINGGALGNAWLIEDVKIVKMLTKKLRLSAILILQKQSLLMKDLKIILTRSIFLL